MSLVRRTKRKHSRVLEYDSTAVPMAVPLGTRIKAVLSKHEGMEQKAYRNPACIMPGCMEEGH